MATWNYRIMELSAHGETSRAIHEVYYDENGALILYTAEPATIWWCVDDAESVPHDILRRMEEAFTKPILRKEDFVKKRLALKHT